jgi:hypothetical protein
LDGVSVDAVNGQCTLDQGKHLMPTNEDIAALANLIRYSEEEAIRLRLHEVIIHCLRMASMEIEKAITDKRSADETAEVEIA